MQDLQTLLDGLKAEKASIEEQTLPFRVERDRLLAQIQPVRDKIRSLEQEYTAMERPRVADLDNQIGKLTVALGGRRMSEGTITSTGA